MPPWKAEPASYAYRDERRLTAEQIALIQTWVKHGCRRAMPPIKPEPPKFTSGWRLGEPDLIVKMPAAYHVPADGPDIYRNIAVPLGLTEDKWITAIDMRPSARAVVHHVLYFADPKGDPMRGRTGGTSRVSAACALAALPSRWAAGRSARSRIFSRRAGAACAERFGLWWCNIISIRRASRRRKNPSSDFISRSSRRTRTLTRIQMPPHYSLFSGLDIPAGEKDFVIRDSYTLPVAVDAVGVGAHAHYIATNNEDDGDTAGRRSENVVADQGLGFCLAGPVLFQAICAAASRDEP